ncbi:hypothetical protein E4O03_03525 [Treponema sp. OMZ 792]|uniref:hypothetical protein n=1 Tax=unclassified Treponema TaxID=2638727 RepID=UPI0020A3A391|nr:MULTISPECIES: hypothetical protein [unclassified Treponema]UTC61766.1 hypothetical protein E4O05_09490 [Treponema sp. OMZ 787]UTC65273.1 hypothetical protein E4O00_03785 [Treponema sp. OMZ 788]UTC75804.1 hypothetical protein E4O03_03525 [Treponema sp. OMZ 792]UTC78387.1 hypothetical protein E4O04_10400 [Treponema sp. OMZ 799]UTC79804.1 hypothetical protein E4O07_03535 [Treponema sp. OMZ 798]
MKKILFFVILLLSFHLLQLFCYGCVEIEMDDNNKKRIENFMSNFYTRIFDLSAEEYEDIFYKKLVSISFCYDGVNGGGAVFKKFLDCTALPENKKTNEIEQPLEQIFLFGNGKNAREFIKQFENIDMFIEKNKAKIVWFSGFDVGVAAFDIPNENCCSFDQDLLLVINKERFNVKATALLYVDEENIFLAYIFFEIKNLEEKSKTI